MSIPAVATVFAARLALAGAVALGGVAMTGCSSGGAHVVTASRDGRQHAELDVLTGATSITVTTGRLGGDLLRASTPADAGIWPDLVVRRTARLRLDSTGTGGPATVAVTLNSGVAWRLSFSGGSSRTSVYLGRGQLRGADFTAGSSQITMRLPRPHGTVTIVLAGGASRVRLAAPAGVPARLRLDGGAATATVGGRTYTGIAGGTVLTAPGWASAADRYDIEAPAGISAIAAASW